MSLAITADRRKTKQQIAIDHIKIGPLDSKPGNEQNGTDGRISLRYSVNCYRSRPAKEPAAFTSSIFSLKSLITVKLKLEVVDVDRRFIQMP